mgnify:FL=1
MKWPKQRVLLVALKAVSACLLLIGSALIGALVAAILHVFTDFFWARPSNQYPSLLLQLTGFYAQFSILAAVLIGPILMVGLKAMRMKLTVKVCVLCGVVVASVPLSILIALTLIWKDGSWASNLSELSFVAALALVGGALGGAFFGWAWRFVPSAAPSPQPKAG